MGREEWRRGHRQVMESVTLSWWHGLLFRPSRLHVFAGHRMQAHDIAWHPLACVSQPTGAVNLASAGSDGVCCLWSLDGSAPLRRLQGHTQRLAQCAFHPLGAYVATTRSAHKQAACDVTSAPPHLSRDGTTPRDPPPLPPPPHTPHYSPNPSTIPTWLPCPTPALNATPTA